MDVTVPSNMPRSIAALEIRHINAPAQFRPDPRRLAHAQNGASGEAPGVSLAIDVKAHDRIFVRGRGVDAQLGGSVRVRGTTRQPLTDGRFEMSRGKLAILGRQLDFNRGIIAFIGSPEPSLDLEAQVDADGTQVIVKVTGPASNPNLKFSSVPELPEEEIVALLLFNKKLVKLSATQVIQLAGEIDKIGGLSSGPGTLDQMKSALGIDVLDVTTDEKGNARATAGSYINDKTYIAVKQGTMLGTSRIVVDHNLTKSLKARGEVGSDGDSKLGLGFEFDY
jgi:translocation and assembly module TamB